jgi:hypothetical protein
MVLVVVAIAVLAIALPRLTATDQERLRQQPEASLFFPGSILLREGGHGATTGSVAETWRQLATERTMDDVLAFYRRELAALGWKTGGGSSAGLVTNESQACVWHTDDVVLRVSFLKMDEFRKQYPSDPEHATVYELRLIDQANAINYVACGHS